MKNFYITMSAKSKSEDVQDIKLDGTTSDKSKRSDVIAWAEKEYPNHAVKTLRLVKKEK